MKIDNLTKEEIIKKIKNKEITRDDFLDSNICATCFDRENNHILYGDDKKRTIYEDNNFIAILVDNPRSRGHAILTTKKHFKNMLELDDETCKLAFVLAKKIMNALKDIYKAETVYLCTMCDGNMNHFHIQFIPRYKNEKRGSKNFIKERQKYIEDKEKVNNLRERLK